MSVKRLCSYPSMPLIVVSLKWILKSSFYLPTILNSKPKTENKITETCKHFYKEDFHVFW